MSSAVFEKKGMSIVPLDDSGADILKQYPDGKRLVATLHVPRNEKHFRLFQILVKKIIEAGAWDGSKDTLTDYIKYATGHVYTFVDPDTGKTIIVTKSLKAESMDDVAFRQWFDAAIKVICEKLLGRKDWAWLRDEIYAATNKNSNYSRARR